MAVNLNLLQSDNMRWRTVGREVVHSKLQERLQFVPPPFKVVALFLNTVQDFSFRALANGIINVDNNLIQDL